MGASIICSTVRMSRLRAGAELFCSRSPVGFAGACFCSRRHDREYGFPFPQDGKVEETLVERRGRRNGELSESEGRQDEPYCDSLPVFHHGSKARLASSACAAALFLCREESRPIHREYIVVNERRGAWKRGTSPQPSLSFFKASLEFCSVCSRTVFLDASQACHISVFCRDKKCPLGYYVSK